MSKNKGRNKRPGSKWVMTKPTSKNKHRRESGAGYAVRMLNRAKFFKLKLQEKFK